MYSKILNPNTNKFVNLNSKLGKKILKTYLFILKGGVIQRLLYPWLSSKDSDGNDMFYYVANVNVNVFEENPSDFDYKLTLEHPGFEPSNSNRIVKPTYNEDAYREFWKFIESKHIETGISKNLLVIMIENDLTKELAQEKMVQDIIKTIFLENGDTLENNGQTIEDVHMALKMYNWDYDEILKKYSENKKFKVFMPL